jgi:hypothetical protein
MYAIVALSMLIIPAYQYVVLLGTQCVPVRQRRTVQVIPCSVPIRCSWYLYKVKFSISVLVRITTAYQYALPVPVRCSWYLYEVKFSISVLVRVNTAYRYALKTCTPM